jgi:hypothetical protein
MSMMPEERNFCNELLALMNREPEPSIEEVKKIYAENLPKFCVEYEGGQSRYGTDSVDYMLVAVPVIDEEGCYEEVELYAEYEYDESEYVYDERGELQLIDDIASYEPLKAEIIRQAGECGFPVEHLAFVYN